MSVNKVQLANGETIIDISDSTVTPETLAEGVVAYNAKGERIVGTHKCSASNGIMSADGYVLKSADGYTFTATE